MASNSAHIKLYILDKGASAHKEIRRFALKELSFNALLKKISEYCNTTEVEVTWWDEEDFVNISSDADLIYAIENLLPNQRTSHPSSPLALTVSIFGKPTVPPPSQSLEHPVTALPLPVHTSKPEEVVHSNITCDGCDVRGIKGLRFKCVVCEDYDLCNNCFKTGLHAHHMLIVLRKPVSDRFLYFRKRLQNSENNNPITSAGDALPSLSEPEVVLSAEELVNTVHQNVTCNTCMTMNIKGIRFICTECNDFDLCQTCFTAGMHKEHSMLVTHKMLSNDKIIFVNGSQPGGLQLLKQTGLVAQQSIGSNSSSNSSSSSTATANSNTNDNTNSQSLTDRCVNVQLGTRYDWELVNKQTSQASTPTESVRSVETPVKSDSFNVLEDSDDDENKNGVVVLCEDIEWLSQLSNQSMNLNTNSSTKPTQEVFSAIHRETPMTVTRQPNTAQPGPVEQPVAAEANAPPPSPKHQQNDNDTNNGNIFVINTSNLNERIKPVMDNAINAVNMMGNVVTSHLNNIAPEDPPATGAPTAPITNELHDQLKEEKLTALKQMGFGRRFTEVRLNSILRDTNYDLNAAIDVCLSKMESN